VSRHSFRQHGLPTAGRAIHQNATRRVNSDL
jgi:hypothetical protein